MSEGEKKNPPANDPKPPPITTPTQPQGPKDTGGAGKRRVEHLDGGQDGPLRLWSCYCPSAAAVAGD